MSATVTTVSATVTTVSATVTTVSATVAISVVIQLLLLILLGIDCTIQIL